MVVVALPWNTPISSRYSAVGHAAVAPVPVAALQYLSTALPYEKGIIRGVKEANKECVRRDWTTWTSVWRFTTVGLMAVATWEATIPGWKFWIGAASQTGSLGAPKNTSIDRLHDWLWNMSRPQETARKMAYDYCGKAFAWSMFSFANSFSAI